jgi:hypothetical protein
VLGLLKNTKIVRHNNGAAAGTSTITPSAGVDMQGFNSAMFLVLLGALTDTTVPSIKIQQSDDDGVADGYSDLEGTAYAVTDADDNKVIAVEIIRPTKRYLKLILARATANAVLDGIVAILGNPIGPLPITQTTLGNEVHVTPAEGTA